MMTLVVQDCIQFRFILYAFVGPEIFFFVSMVGFAHTFLIKFTYILLLFFCEGYLFLSNLTLVVNIQNKFDIWKRPNYFHVHF